MHEKAKIRLEEILAEHDRLRAQATVQLEEDARVTATFMDRFERMKDSICYIGAQKNYVNLGFHKGTSLRDPQRILEGTGKQMRHIKIKSMTDLLNPAIRAYLQGACERADHEVTSHKVRTVTTAVKRKSLPKKTLGTTRL